MKYTIEGNNLPVAILELEKNETVYTQSGGMGWMSDDIEMSTNMKGGLLKGLGRKLSGESLFIASFKGTGSKNLISFPSSFPGKIVPVELSSDQSLICQKKSFLCAHESVTLEMHFRKKLGAGLFGGEGFILQKIQGPGTAFMEFDGHVVEYNLLPGEVFKVDTGHVAMFEPTITYSIDMIKGFSNILFGGEGLFLATLTGPGKIWLQSMPIENLATRIIPFIPTQTK